MTLRGFIVGVLSAALIFAAVAGGYLIGESEAPTPEEAEAARLASADLAEEDAFATAYERGVRRGKEDGLKRGRREGEEVGAEIGSRTGGKRADREIAAIEAEAAADPYAGLEYSSELPTGNPGYLLPEEERSIACIGYDAVTGECVGD